MARLCERPGCSQPASVAYGIDNERLVVWIETFDRAVTDRLSVLCRRHADAMVVPLGWMLDDHRDPEPQLFKPPAPPRALQHSSVPRQDRLTRRPARPAPGEQLDLTGEFERPTIDAGISAVTVLPERLVEPEPEHTAEPEAEPDPAPLPWKPVFDQHDDLGGLLSTSSPLLARAFRGDSRRDAAAPAPGGQDNDR